MALFLFFYGAIIAFVWFLFGQLLPRLSTSIALSYLWQMFPSLNCYVAQPCFFFCLYLYLKSPSSAQELLLNANLSGRAFRAAVKLPTSHLKLNVQPPLMIQLPANARPGRQWVKAQVGLCHPCWKTQTKSQNHGFSLAQWMKDLCTQNKYKN